jgi:hypothetical protein
MKFELPQSWKAGFPMKLDMSQGKVWKIGLPIFLIVLMVLYFTMGLWYKQTYGRYRSTNESIQQLLTIRRHVLGEAIDSLKPNDSSICNSLLKKTGVYGQVGESKTALVNWRPLTVRVAGYLGGDTTARDGVFDMKKGIQLALILGARSFIFDIDYLDKTPCEPVVIHRDENKFMRSLHVGSIQEGMETLKQMAFSSNYDPVIVVIYLRRIPDGKVQQSSFFKSIASQLNPLSMYHLGATEKGTFHNCRSESFLFTSEITDFQKKFIVLCNYNTNLLPQTQNPKDNLDFWVNSRLYVDELGKSSDLGDVTDTAPNGQVPYAQVGSTTQLLMVPDADKSKYNDKSSNTFKIALSPVDKILSINEMVTLLNALGIQCVPIDVVRLGSTKEHLGTLNNKKDPITLEDLSNPTNQKDILSFWTHGGYSRKLIIEGFEDAPPAPLAARIPGFIIPKPVVPKKPPPSTNSNGGLVSIA